MVGRSVTVARLIKKEHELVNSCFRSNWDHGRFLVPRLEWGQIGQGEPWASWAAGAAGFGQVAFWGGDLVVGWPGPGPWVCVVSGLSLWGLGSAVVGAAKRSGFAVASDCESAPR